MIRLAGLVIAWLFCFGFALAGGWSVMWMLTYLLALLLVGGFVWSQLNVSRLELRRRHRPRRVQVGDVLTEQVILEARDGWSRWWPRLWLELHDGATLPGHHLDSVVSLGFVGRRVWELRSTCMQRGRFSLGPVWVASGDPFGLFRATRALGTGGQIVVYPRAVEIPRFGRLPGELPGGALQGARVHVSTANVSTVREYRPGDPFNRIHWPTTARTGHMMVREFELDPSSDLWIILDMGRDVQAGRGLESTEEHGVTAAASLAKYFLQQGRSVGLLSQVVSLPTDRGHRQLERILEVLALVRATSHVDLAALLPAETARFARGSTLLVITPSTDPRWVSFCHTLGGRGVHTSAIVVDASTFGVAPSLLPTFGALAAARMSTYVVKKGQPLQQAFAIPTGERTASAGVPTGSVVPARSAS